MYDFDERDRPPTGRPTMWVRRLAANESFQCTILSEAPYALMVHYANKRSSPHLRNKEQCPGCARKEGMRWKLYLHVLHHAKRQEEFLELPTVAGETFLTFFPKGSMIRGQRVQFNKGNGEKTRVNITLLPPLCSVDSTALPQPKDPKKTLIELWGLLPNTGRFGDETDVA